MFAVHSFYRSRVRAAWLAGVIMTFALLPSTVEASWLVRLLTTPPEMLTAAIQPDEEKLDKVPGYRFASTTIYPNSAAYPDSPAYLDRLGSQLTPADNGVDEQAATPTEGNNGADEIELASATQRDEPPKTQVGSFRRRLIPGQDLEQVQDSLGLDSPVMMPDSSLSRVTQTALLSRTLYIPNEGVFSWTLKQEGVSEEDAKAIVAAISPHYDLREVPKGTTLKVKLNGQVPAGENGRLQSLYLAPDDLTKLSIKQDADGSFQCEADTRKLKTRWVMARGSIKIGDIHQNAKRYNIPERIVANMIRAHRHWLNLEKSLKKGDQFSVLFEAEVDPKTGEIYKSGEILYTGIRYKGKKTGLYWFDNGSQSNWYKQNGASTKRGMTLSRKPIKRGRNSSSFGMRNHPILKKKTMHWGTDYAAPSGTPIYAAGSGTIKYSGWKGGYGRHIEIRHNGTYSTTYSHMSKFAKNMKKGKRVSRGQVIGYVGSSGRSTGPHLHYEVIKNGKKVNPLGKQIPVPFVLSGSSKSKFKSQVSKIDRLIGGAMSSEQAKLR